jgi:hypothetical protein
MKIETLLLALQNKRIIREHYEQLYNHKLEKLCEMGKLPEGDKKLKVTREETVCIYK